MALEDEKAFISLSKDVEVIQEKVKDMDLAQKEDRSEFKKANDTLTEMKALTETAMESHGKSIDKLDNRFWGLLSGGILTILGAFVAYVLTL